MNYLNSLCQKTTLNDKFVVLRNFIIELQLNSDQQEDKLVELFVGQIRIRKGKTGIQSLAKENHLSIRQLQRRFKHSTGLTIKEFSSIVRFNNAIKIINEDNKKSLLKIAFDTGFYDHSHMTHDFNRISGRSPSFFRTSRFSTKRFLM